MTFSSIIEKDIDTNYYTILKIVIFRPQAFIKLEIFYEVPIAAFITAFRPRFNLS